MDATIKPVEDTDLDPYREIPLGVEAAWCPGGIDALRGLAIAIAAATLAGCAQAPAGQDDAARPDWLRDPARSQYPYNPRW